MKTNYRERLAASGFSPMEINVVEFVGVCSGLLIVCEHERPQFVECYPLDEEIDRDSGLTFSEARWRKAMRGAGFREPAIILAEQALGLLGEAGCA